MTMLKAEHPSDYRDKLFLSRKEGGTGRTCIEDCVDASIQGIKGNTKKCKERGMTVLVTVMVKWG